MFFRPISLSPPQHLTLFGNCCVVFSYLKKPSNEVFSLFLKCMRNVAKICNYYYFFFG